MILGIFDPQTPAKGFHPFKSPKQEAKQVPSSTWGPGAPPLVWGLGTEGPHI